MRQDRVHLVCLVQDLGLQGHAGQDRVHLVCPVQDLGLQGRVGQDRVHLVCLVQALRLPHQTNGPEFLQKTRPH